MVGVDFPTRNVKSDDFEKRRIGHPTVKFNWSEFSDRRTGIRRLCQNRRTFPTVMNCRIVTT